VAIRPILPQNFLFGSNTVGSYGSSTKARVVAGTKASDFAVCRAFSELFFRQQALRVCNRSLP
jgi:hypothetical protein